ncbi:TIM21-domain-containing protein [Halteromyces radiatus]|uniref:TIM21-domain-containing protein n=1 Tax=Halteromyces radiatus TaxID=101107 RepID=UPI00221E67C4|nr:TIM21-domain-containing protein [Halteromyces radiatus]KAI8093271.1 TIM21-domain-containing protein [Halteromyces radiatus]
MLRTIRSLPTPRRTIPTCTRSITNTSSNKATHNRQSLISQQTVKQWKDLTPPQKVAAASKASFNFTIVGVGLLVTAGLLYGVGSEFFNSKSPTNIFSDAVDRARKNQELVDILGTPIKGHGAPSRNRMKRNRRIQHQIMDDHQGNPHLFMKFYVEGPNNEGTGMLEMIKDEKGQWQYKQLFVDVPGQGLPSKRIHLDQL